MAPFKFRSQTIKGSKGCNLYYHTLWYQGLNQCDGGEHTLKDEAPPTSKSYENDHHLNEGMKPSDSITEYYRNPLDPTGHGFVTQLKSKSDERHV